MQIQVKVNKKYSLTVEATEDGPIKVTDCSADLAVNNLFRHPFSPRRASAAFHQLVPLKAKAEEAFRALSFLDSNSPFVAALIRYYDERFPKIVNELELPLRYDAHGVSERLHRLRSNPSQAANTLRTVIAAINSADRTFFSVEKMLGTFEWLRSGDPDLLPCPLIPESAGSHSSAFGYLTPQQDRCLFQIGQQAAFVQDDALPNPLATLEALCLGGRCDLSVLYANRAAAMLAMCANYSNEIALALDTVETAERHKQSPQWLRRWPFRRDTAIIGTSIIAGGLGLSGAAASLIGETGSVLLFLAALASGSSAYAGSKRAQIVSDQHHPSPTEVRDAQRLLNEQRPLIQSTLSVVLLRFLDGWGSASEHSPVVPSLDLLWRGDFTGTAGLDLRIIPQTTRVSKTGMHTISYWPETPELKIVGESGADSLDRDFRHRIHEELASQYRCLEHSAVADQYWNTLKAIQVATSFARGAGLGEALHLPLFYFNLMRDAQSLTRDSSGKVGIIDSAFERILKHYGLFQSDQEEQEAWAFCAQPLLFIDQLERSYAQLSAQRIALAALSSERL